jgi:uncharacterized protein (TIGR02145 family)
MSQYQKLFFQLFCSYVIVVGIFVYSGCKKSEPERVIKLVTDSVTNITYNSCTVQATLIDAGSSHIDQHGFCWSDRPDPTTEDFKNMLGPLNNTGIYTSKLTGLLPNTTYYVKAYASGTGDTEYGSEISFATLKGFATLTTAEVTDITLTTAVSGGNIIDDGGASITQRGVCWNKTGNPTLENSDDMTRDGTGTGVFTSTITGRTKGTTYYVRAYAINIIDTSFGDVREFMAFECGISVITDYDGNEYQTVQIGDQCWLKENLKVTHYSDGSSIPFVEKYYDWSDLGPQDKAYCYSQNSATNLDLYGALYTWAAAMNGAASSNANPSGIQGVCPDGWHLPSDSEWKQLEMYLGMSQSEADDIQYRGTTEGGEMKEAGTSHWNSPNTGADNSSGFTALPGGGRNVYGNYIGLGENADIWSSTENDSEQAWFRILHHNSSKVVRYDNFKYWGFSVRCIWDE